MSKAGSSLLRTTLVRAADTARKQDPQLARIYYLQMVERGKDHLGALCVVAANLAERAWAAMHRQMPYVICDTDGRPVTPDQAEATIAEHWTVPGDLRAPPAIQEGGEGPPESPRRTVEATRSRRRQTGRPSPAGIVQRTPRPRQPSEHQFEPKNLLTTDPP